MRRDWQGPSYINGVVEEIALIAEDRYIDPLVLAAILVHESTVPERLFGYLGSRAAILKSGKMASLGPAQVQLRRAEELEAKGYAWPSKSEDERINRLLGYKTSLEYASGMVRLIQDELRQKGVDSGGQSFYSLSIDQQRRLMLISYNEGHEKVLTKAAELGFDRTIATYRYDDEALDAYARWSGSR